MYYDFFDFLDFHFLGLPLFFFQKILCTKSRKRCMKLPKSASEKSILCTFYTKWNRNERREKLYDTDGTRGNDASTGSGMRIPSASSGTRARISGLFHTLSVYFHLCADTRIACHKHSIHIFRSQ